jgi:hypothetical protein
MSTTQIELELETEGQCHTSVKKEKLTFKMVTKPARSAGLKTTSRRIIQSDYVQMHLILVRIQKTTYEASPLIEENLLIVLR